MHRVRRSSPPTTCGRWRTAPNRVASTPGWDGDRRPPPGSDWDWFPRPHRTQRSVDRRRRIQRDDLTYRHARLGQGSGLVDAHHVDAGQHLDSWHLLHQRPLPAEPDHGHGHRGAGQQHEAFGDHRHHAGHGAGEGIAPVRAGPNLGDEEQRPQRHQNVGHDADEAHDRRHQFALGDGEFARLGCELGRVGIHAHFGGTHQPAAGDHEGPAAHLVADVLGDRVGLAGQQRLVGLQPRTRQDLTVHHDLIADAQLDDVVEHDLRRADRRGGPVTHHHRLGLTDQ